MTSEAETLLQRSAGEPAAAATAAETPRAVTGDVRPGRLGFRTTMAASSAVLAAAALAIALSVALALAASGLLGQPSTVRSSAHERLLVDHFGQQAPPRMLPSTHSSPGEAAADAVAAPVSKLLDPFDCSEGLSDFEDSWSPDKKTWCCEEYHKGCEHAKSTKSAGSAKSSKATHSTTTTEKHAPSPPSHSDAGKAASSGKSKEAASTSEHVASSAKSTEAASTSTTAKHVAKHVAGSAKSTEASSANATSAKHAPRPTPRPKATPRPTAKPTAKPTAEPTPEPTPAPTPQPTSCADDNQDCSLSKCCVQPGHQCYEKMKGWATCKIACKPGPDPTDDNSDPWSCKELGERAPGEIQWLSPNRGKVQPAQWVADYCPPNGEDCGKHNCCKENGMQCYKKDKNWASCNASCSAEDWDCEELGSRTPRPWGNPSLFCVAVLRPDGYEPGLMRGCLSMNAGIFGCDEYAVFSSEEVDLGGGPLGQIKTIPFEQAPVGTSIHGTAANTELFIKFWEAVRMDGRYKDLDWTLKADPDAVIIPVRIRAHLQGKGGALYVRNCNAFPGSPDFPMMYGALEAISVDAMNAYYDRNQECMSLPWQDWGEDFFLGKCLLQLGVSPLDDFDLVGDGVCAGVDCNNQFQAAFHPKKELDEWIQCWNDAGR